MAEQKEVPRGFSKVEIWVSCRNLPKMDRLSKSDPMAVLEIFKNGAWEEQQRSEWIKNNHDPDFEKQFVMEYHFEQRQRFRFSIYDVDNESSKLEKQDFIGYVDVVLGDLVTAPNQTLEASLICEKTDEATIIMKVEEMTTSKSKLKVQFRCENLDKKDFFGKSDPYLEFYRLREDGSWLKIHQTEVIKSNLNPTFEAQLISLQVLCNGDISRPMKVKCWDWDRNSDDDLIGECDLRIKDLLDEKEYREPFINEEIQKKKKKKYKNSGELICVHASLVVEYSFLDYISGGCNISLMTAIDYTGSNGNPADPKSLHYIQGDAPNQYQSALQTIGEILSPYDTDGKIPVWGFGGRLPSGNVSHCFPLNFNDEDPEVDGVKGMLDIYEDAIYKVGLSGPTLFEEIINTATAISMDTGCTQNNQNNSILLILTDGVINDMKYTIRSIVNASNQPLSIVIVGIGNADFSQMEELDGDDALLESDQGKAKRDIVQFVPFRVHNFNSVNLAKEVLYEIPGQFMEFMKSNRIIPNKQ
jgi:hypothetical protein